MGSSLPGKTSVETLGHFDAQIDAALKAIGRLPSPKEGSSEEQAILEDLVKVLILWITHSCITHSLLVTGTPTNPEKHVTRVIGSIEYCFSLSHTRSISLAHTFR